MCYHFVRSLVINLDSIQFRLILPLVISLTTFFLADGELGCEFSSLIVLGLLKFGSSATSE